MKINSILIMNIIWWVILFLNRSKRAGVSDTITFFYNVTKATADVFAIWV